MNKSEFFTFLRAHYFLYFFNFNYFIIIFEFNENKKSEFSRKGTEYIFLKTLNHSLFSFVFLNNQICKFSLRVHFLGIYYLI